jgi:hypothetical protein
MSHIPPGATCAQNSKHRAHQQLSAKAFAKRVRALDPKQIEQTSDIDRRWFEQHPHRQATMRPPRPDELPLGPDVRQVLVIKLGPGLRIRIPLMAGDYIDHDDFLLRLGIRSAPNEWVRRVLVAQRKRLPPVYVHTPGRA